MKVRVKKLNEKAVVPAYSHPTDAGLDLTATTFDFNEKTGIVTYGTGLAFEIPIGYVGLLFPRSSVSKKDLSLCNSVGVVDSNYRGEVMLKFRAFGNNIYKIGDRVGQLIIMPYPAIELEETDQLTDSDRGEGGFGSTGK